MKLPISEKNFNLAGKYKGGVEEAVKMLHGLDAEMRQKVLDYIHVRDPKIADEIKMKLVCFEDLQYLDAKALQLVFKKIDMNKLGLGLRMSSDELKQIIFNNVSTNVKKDLLVFIDGPAQKKSDVLAAQEHIIVVLRQLSQRGEIELKRSNDDETYV